MARPDRLPRFGKRMRATRANARARDLERQGRHDEAIEEYERACRIDPEWSVPFYNLGLVYKCECEWELSLENNRRATELASDDEAAWWNLGIAATAVGRWDVARHAWKGAGISVPEGDGPLEFPCGAAPIRLNPHADAEVVWSERLDPARAVLRSIPLPDSGFRYGDVVLHDGAPNGYRKLGGVDVPVFDCLDLLEPSLFSTCVADVDLGSPERAAQQPDIDRLIDMAVERRLGAEDWTSNIRLLCRACSEGREHSEHDHGPEEGAVHRIAIAAPGPAEARALLDAWLATSSGANLVSFEVALDAGAI